MIIKKSNLKLVPSGSSILHNTPKDFIFNGDIDPAMLSNVLHDRMKELGGIGLSANQVGLDLKVFVLGAGDIQMTVFNPEIVEYSEELVTLDEGCLSFPGIYLKVNRPSSARVKYQDSTGKLIEQNLTGLTARIFLHEYDHMLGKTFKSRVSSLKWDMAVKKVAKKTKKLVQKYYQKEIQLINEKVKNDLNT